MTLTSPIDNLSIISSAFVLPHSCIDFFYIESYANAIRLILGRFCSSIYGHCQVRTMSFGAANCLFFFSVKSHLQKGADR